MRNALALASRRWLHHVRLLLLTAFSVALSACYTGDHHAPDPFDIPAPSSTQIGHVFVIVLENESFATTFGSSSPATYLSQTLPLHGALLRHYYGTAHNSQSNYVAMISGLGTNLQMQADCQIFSEFIAVPNTQPYGQLPSGTGCVFSEDYPELTGQLDAAGLTWRAYMQSMGNDPTREAATCGHPVLNRLDPTQAATAIDSYATRHNPFVYFHRIIDDQAYCDSHVVNFDTLVADLSSEATTPNYVFITPDLCNDGHDSPCADGQVGGLKQADSFLQQWVSKVLLSPAFKKDGLLIITFDESEGPEDDSTACCGEVGLSGLTGPGGGLTGAVLLSPFINGGTVSYLDYNHFSMLRTVQDLFGLNYLGYAGISEQNSFGVDIFTRQVPAFPAKPGVIANTVSHSLAASGAHAGR